MDDETDGISIDTAFNQQRLKSWQPLLTPKVVLPSYFIVGLFFIPIGIALFYASENVGLRCLSFLALLVPVADIRT